MKITSKEAIDVMGMGKWVDWFWNQTPADHRKKIRSSEQPIHLYKYRSFDTPEQIDFVRSMVVCGELWIAHKKQLNDPYDLDYDLIENKDRQVRTSWFNKNAEHLKDLSPVEQIIARERMVWHSLGDDYIAASKEKVWDRLGVFCASSDPRSMHMWTNYASNGRGISVQLAQHHDPIFLFSKKVIYQNEIPKILFPSDFIEEPYLRKSLNWELEKEWRILILQNKVVLKVDPRAITGVIIGHAADEKVEPIFRDYNKERLAAGLPPFTIWKSVVRARKYGFEIRKL